MSKLPLKHQKTLQTIVKSIKKAQTFLVVSHEHPEGDALGSTLALGLALEQLGKKVDYYNVDPCPWVLKFLPGSKKLSRKLKTKSLYDIAFIVDVGSRKRVSQAFCDYERYKKLICIDHHAVGQHEGDINFVMSDAPATGVPLYYLLKALGLKKFSTDIATNLYTAIATDTGGFRYPNTTSDTLRMAAELLDCGVDGWQISKQCFETIPQPKMKLLKRVLQSLTVYPKLPVASIRITSNDYKVCGATAEHAEGMVDYARGVEDVEIGLMFRQIDKNKYKVSLRSNAYLNVAELASVFGGGGHKRAAGCTLKGSFKEIERQMLKAIRQVL